MANYAFPAVSVGYNFDNFCHSCYWIEIVVFRAGDCFYFHQILFVPRDELECIAVFLAADILLEKLCFHQSHVVPFVEFETFVGWHCLERVA